MDTFARTCWLMIELLVACFVFLLCFLLKEKGCLLNSIVRTSLIPVHVVACRTFFHQKQTVWAIR